MKQNKNIKFKIELPIVEIVNKLVACDYNISKVSDYTGYSDIEVIYAMSKVGGKEWNKKLNKRNNR